MGIVCEFYIVEDEVINDFLANPLEFEEYFDGNYVFVDGKFHIEEENMFYCDKAWDIARFLFQQNSNSLEELMGQPIKNTEMKSFIKSDETKKINDILSEITLPQIEKTYLEFRTPNNFVYNYKEIGIPENWIYVSEHVKTFYKVFKKAAKKKAGIIISRG